MNFFKQHKKETFLFALALVARLSLFGIDLDASHGNFIATIYGDDGYYEIANNLVAGHGFSSVVTAPYIPNPLRTPGYPFFIAGILLLFGSYSAVIIIQILMGALIPLLGRRMSLHLLPDAPRLAFWVGVALALEPYYLLHSFLLVTETLFIFLFLAFFLALFAYLKRPSLTMLIVSAILFGLATLTKPTIEYAPFLLIPLIMYANWKESARQALVHGAVFGLFVLALLAPWFSYNYKTFGVAGMSAQPAYNSYVYLAPSVVAIERDKHFDEEFLGFATPEEHAGNVITLANSASYIAKAWAIIAAHPRGFIISSGMAVINFFTEDGVTTVYQHAGYEPDAHLQNSALYLLIAHPRTLLAAIQEYAFSPLVLVLFMRIAWVGITIAFIFGYVLRLRAAPRDSRLWFVGLLVAYIALTSAITGYGVSARYRMPLDPFIFLFAFVGFKVAWSALCRRLANIRKSA